MRARKLQPEAFPNWCIQGGGHSHRLCSHNCNRSRSMVNGQSRSKGCGQRSKPLKRVWSTVKAAQKGVVNSQSALKNTVNANNGRSQRGIDGLVRKNNIPQLVTRAHSGRLGSSCSKGCGQRSKRAQKYCQR